MGGFTVRRAYTRKSPAKPKTEKLETGVVTNWTSQWDPDNLATLKLPTTASECYTDNIEEVAPNFSGTNILVMHTDTSLELVSPAVLTNLNIPCLPLSRVTSPVRRAEILTAILQEREKESTYLTTYCTPVVQLLLGTSHDELVVQELSKALLYYLINPAIFRLTYVCYFP
jgi:hypothetical protein